MTQTIADRLSYCSNRPAGFDYMRLVLSSLVVWTHTANVVLGFEGIRAVWDSPARPFVAMILVMFFGLSGFLVAGSLERCRTMVSFLGLRLIRLVPALAVDTTISALLIGPIFTTLVLEDYLSSPVLWQYFLNIIGELHYSLPGVFEQNPRWQVNDQLWTLPYELKCYIGLTVLSVLGIVRYRWLFLSCVTGLIIYLLVASLLKSFTLPTPEFYAQIDGRGLIISFLLGVSAYLFRDRIVLSPLLFWVALCAALVMLWITRIDYLALIPASYVTVYLGLLTPRRLKIVSSGDYSYGIFLYGWPIQQSVYAMGGKSLWSNLLISYPLVVLLAIGSWFLVEKPALKLRSWIYRAEQQAISLAHRHPFGHWVVQPPVGPWLRRSPARGNI